MNGIFTGSILLLMFYQAKQAKLTEDASEPFNRTVADQEGLAEGTMMVDLRIRLPDGQVR